jgi:hypothetical protein
VAKQGQVGEVPQLARVPELEITDRPVLAGALDLEPVVDADRPVVAVQVVLQRAQESTAADRPLRVGGEDRVGDLVRGGGVGQPHALGQQQRAVGQVQVGVTLAADVAEQCAELDGRAEGLVEHLVAAAAQVLDEGVAHEAGLVGGRVLVGIHDREVEVAGGRGLEATERADGEHGERGRDLEAGERLTDLDLALPRALGGGEHVARLAGSTPSSSSSGR